MPGSHPRLSRLLPFSSCLPLSHSVRGSVRLFPFCLLACLLFLPPPPPDCISSRSYIQPTSLAHLTDGSYGSITPLHSGVTSLLLHKLSLLLLAADTEISCCFIWSLFSPSLGYIFRFPFRGPGEAQAEVSRPPNPICPSHGSPPSFPRMSPVLQLLATHSRLGLERTASTAKSSRSSWV